MENVMYVANTLREKTEFVRDNMDWQAYWEEVQTSEVLYFSIVFLLAKVLLFPLPENVRKSYLNPFLKLYNLGMSIFSLGCFVAMLQALTEIKLYSEDCEAAFEHPVFNLTSKLFFYSKFVEYIDSWSLALARKPVSFLQSFHHLGAPWDLYVFFVAKNEGIWIFVLLNGFVHTIMYAYYLVTLYKIKVPLKPLITIMQIAQFNLGFYLVWFYKDIPCYAQDPRRMFGWLFNYFYVGVVLLLFINFSIWTYVFPSKKAAPKKKIN